MKIFGRSPKRLWSVLPSLPDHVIAAVRCVRLFRQPIHLLVCYARRQNPLDRQVRLRNGVVLYMSEDPSDIVTVYIIFCRHDYGLIPNGVSVIDIGANIGIFSVYAALSGAGTVHAYEPCEESFEILNKNISCNHLEQTIIPRQAVVVGRPSEPILFPRRSSVFNSQEQKSAIDSDKNTFVKAVTLEEIVRAVHSPSVLKLDCEGGEYDIILNSNTSAFDRLSEIRLEYHRGPQEQLFDRFEKLGYSKRKHIHEGAGGGYLWLNKDSLN